MKKFILAACAVALSFCAPAQTIKRDAAGNFYEVKKPDTMAVLTKHVYTNSKGVKFPVWRSAKGKYFVNICPASGNWYKKYLTVN